MTVGLNPRSAKALAAAGYGSLLGLAGALRDQLLAIPGVGAASLAVLDEVLGRTLAWPETVWRKRGVPPSAAITFAQEGMTLERLSSISREELLGMAGAGRETLRICELIVGHRILSRD